MHPTCRCFPINFNCYKNFTLTKRCACGGKSCFEIDGKSPPADCAHWSMCWILDWRPVVFVPIVFGRIVCVTFWSAWWVYFSVFVCRWHWSVCCPVWQFLNVSIGNFGCFSRSISTTIQFIRNTRWGKRSYNLFFFFTFKTAFLSWKPKLFAHGWFLENEFTLIF